MIDHNKRKNKRSGKKNTLYYDCLPTLDILERIVVHHDRQALNHFHERRKLFYHNGKWLVLSNYIYMLTRTEIPFYVLLKSRDPEDFKNQVNDLTINRFFPMSPAEATPKGQGDTENTSTGYIKLYKLVLEGIKSWRSKNPEALPLEEEHQVGILFQGLVSWHFRYCIKEVQRKRNNLQNRYTWKIGNDSVTVYKPVWIKGNEFRKWLEEHIDDPDPHRPGEKDRIQGLVDDYFDVGAHIPFDTVEEEAYKYPEIYESPNYLESHEKFNILAHRVAFKKELEIEHLRPSIQALGKTKIKHLVLRILNDLAYGKYNTTQILKDYNLSKATLSRFARISLDKTSKSAAEQNIPDLWQNLAEVIMSDPDSIEAAISSETEKLIDIIVNDSGITDQGTE